MKFVKGDKVRYNGDDLEVEGYDYMSGEYKVYQSGRGFRWVDGNIFEKNAVLTTGVSIEGFETFFDPPPVPEDALWCKCNNEDKELVRVVVLKKHHAICRTCKKEDKSNYGEKFLKGELK